MPNFQKITGISNIILFILPFTLVDYLYYWNHRLLHKINFWFLHRVHHTSEKLDIWVTSRNSLWTPIFLIYIWVHAFLIFSVADSTAYVTGMYLHGLLDMIRHSGLQTPKRMQFLGRIFILPEDHEWHHALSREGINYGANLNVWDRLHGTFYRSKERPSILGTGSRHTLFLEWIMPWRIKS